MNKLWTQEEIDWTLNLVLPADSIERFKGLCQIAGDALSRTPDSIDRVVWGLATRITMINYEPGPTRTARTGISFLDIQIIKWAAEAHVKDKRRRNGPADTLFLSKVIGHSLPVVEKLWKEYGPAKGRTGFALKPLKISDE